MTDLTLAVELWAIDKIKPHPKNPKKHAPEQVKNLAELIKRNGWTQPIVVEGDGTIIAGHGRRLAAIELGLKKVPVICRKDLTSEQASALRLADNRIASTDYDIKLEQEQLLELAACGLDFSLTMLGYSDKELEFLAEDMLGDIDLSVMSDDIGDAVEEQKKNNKALSDDIDGSAAPVGDAFGFKRVTVEQSRDIRKFMNKVETDTGLKGADALLAFIRSL
jgi:ParB-like chromosome segregation protein Spo0J